MNSLLVCRGSWVHHREDNPGSISKLVVGKGLRGELDVRSRRPRVSVVDMILILSEEKVGICRSTRIQA